MHSCRDQGRISAISYLTMLPDLTLTFSKLTLIFTLRDTSIPVKTPFLLLFFCIFHMCVISGPGSYNITGMGSESMRKAYIESTRKGVFGTTSVRINNITKKEAPELPGPNHYQVKEKPFQSRYAHLSSTFASVTTRLKEENVMAKVSCT